MAATPSHRGWTHRDQLPHADFAELHHAISYRLEDALPHAVVERLLDQTRTNDRLRRRRLEILADRGFGRCLLRDEAIARIVVDAWRFFDGTRYRLEAWVVMPNHVHVLVPLDQGWPLARVVESWKSYTAKAINRLLGSSAPSGRRIIGIDSSATNVTSSQQWNIFTEIR